MDDPIHYYNDELPIRFYNFDSIRFAVENSDSQIYVLPNINKRSKENFRALKNRSCEHIRFKTLRSKKHIFNTLYFIYFIL